MPGMLTHSPADVFRHLLVDLGIASLPPGTPWPAYVGGEPDSPDAVITIYNSDGRDSGRVMWDGERQEHSGVQVKVRASINPEAFAKARAVAVAMDASVYDTPVSVGSSTYRVHSVSRTTDVIDMLKESLATKRSVMTVNAVISLRQTA